ncbi:MAG: aldehyde ferredoxin oxidoreductase C-terminal domain-containing protein, partial [Candidatus Bathyarchaeia archaeon]
KTKLGHRIIQIQRAAELLGGPDVTWDPKKDDDNPKRFYEPLPSGPYKGVTTDWKVVQRRKKEYYDLIGWDERGIPKSEVLRKLGLLDVDTALQSLRV